MNFLSAKFLIYVSASAVFYYLAPKKWRWSVLLFFSWLLYAVSEGRLILFLLFSTLSSYLGGLAVSALSAGTGGRKTIRTKQRLVLALCLLSNFGILFTLKYASFTAGLFGKNPAMFQWALPVGISFYTFQSMGYLLDVYWKRIQPERNPFRFALFVSFFPQLLQGPIGRYKSLSGRLFEGHSFNPTQVEHGVQRMLWGYFLKFVLADRAGVPVEAIFSNYKNYSGFMSIAGVLFYSIQLYADFAGGMEVVIGTAEVFGVNLDENFRQPYFSVSITDFWHRWHITLGTWMKDYLFYPLSLSKLFSRYGKHTKKVFGKETGRIMPFALANIVVFLAVGIWHGSGWKYIIYGLYNGILIAMANLSAPLCTRLFRITHIDPKSRFMHIFRILRTFFLVNISWYFDAPANLDAGLYMLKSVFTGFSLKPFADGTFLKIGLTAADYGILLFGILVLFTVSLLKEKGHRIRDEIDQKSLAARWSLYTALFLAVSLIGMNDISGGGGFIYAQF